MQSDLCSIEPSCIILRILVSHQQANKSYVLKIQQIRGKQRRNQILVKLRIVLQCWSRVLITTR
ncbi:hypothetical protein HanPSC8_Chr01g0032881 [Helianthus annuus]|nr:hypothetical protein HanPSC8_Chr01g0032881 [Helianthus annuus]